MISWKTKTDVSIYLCPGINGMNRIVFDNGTEIQSQILMNDGDIDILIEKLQEMRGKIDYRDLVIDEIEAELAIGAGEQKETYKRWHNMLKGIIDL